MCWIRIFFTDSFGAIAWLSFVAFTQTEMMASRSPRFALPLRDHDHAYSRLFDERRSLQLSFRLRQALEVTVIGD